MIWYGRTMTERENYDEAEFLFRNLWEDGYLPKSLYDDLATAEAHLYIKQKRYDKAIEPLRNAISFTENKRRRARLAFILAQLYDRSGQYEQSYETYNEVLANLPVYEMDFNARLQQTYAGWAHGKITGEEAVKTLDRMLKDDKNLEYRDQIYYTLAMISLKDGKKQDGIANLRRSLSFAEGNNAQRAETYLMLADLYFEEEDFVSAKLYYDSTLTVLPTTDERFKRAQDYASNLKDIARLIQTIAANDSIVRVFKMGPEERKELAKILRKQKEAEAAAKAAKAKPVSAADAAKAAAPPPQAGQKPSSFYFYNDAFVKKGKKDFTRIWGERKLEDNWRRSNKISAGADAAAAIDSTSTDAAAEADLKDLFASIPKTEEELSVVHMATYEAMYQLGTLFRDKLQNNIRCVGTLEELQVRYPDTARYEKETWYYCFLAHNDLTNTERATYYLEKLKGKYPNSAFARVLTDPNFQNAAKERERELNKYYEETFRMFQSGGYKDAYTRCQDAPKRFGSQNQLMPKFFLLSALCVGNLSGSEAYCSSLGEVVSRYPDSPEATRAKEIARLLSCKGFETDDKKKTDGPIDDAFTVEDDKLHYFIIALRGDNVRLDDIKAAITDYNRENHKLEQLRISNIFLGTDTNLPIVVIRKFDNKDQAMKYYDEVKGRKDFLGESGKKTYDKEYFAVTQENYRRILKNKTLDGYRDFYEENYLK
jgi:tetratricopeptide (TPR) repeat protein